MCPGKSMLVGLVAFAGCTNPGGTQVDQRAGVDLHVERTREFQAPHWDTVDPEDPDYPKQCANGSWSRGFVEILQSKRTDEGAAVHLRVGSKKDSETIRIVPQILAATRDGKKGALVHIRSLTVKLIIQNGHEATFWFDLEYDRILEFLNGADPTGQLAKRFVVHTPVAMAALWENPQEGKEDHQWGSFLRPGRTVNQCFEPNCVLEVPQRLKKPIPTGPPLLVPQFLVPDLDRFTKDVARRIGKGVESSIEERPSAEQEQEEQAWLGDLDPRDVFFYLKPS